MTYTLSTLVNEALPALSGSSVAYNKERNMYVTNGYTSAMGHTYFQGIHLSNRVAVVLNIGRGGWGSNPYFLNGVSVYCFDGKDKKLIGSWTPNTWAFYSDMLAQKVAVMLLLQYLKSQAMLSGARISDSELGEFAIAQIQAAETSRPSLS